MGPAEPQSADVASGVGESEIVRRSAKGLAACLACDICRGLLVEPLTSPHCMHCFCAACITGFIVPGRSTNCPVCAAEGAKTSLGPDPLRDQLRVDFMLTDLIRKISAQLASVATSRETRVERWHALSRAITARSGSAKVSEPAAKPLKQLPADGTGCVELFISAPEGHELEQPYIRLHEAVTVAQLARFLRERILSVAPGDLTVRLRCRGAELQNDQSLGEVNSQLWQPHAACGQLLQVDLDWPMAGAAPG